MTTTVTPDYDAVLDAPGFSLGVRCTPDEITAIDFLPSRPAQAPTLPLAAEAVRQLHAYLADARFVVALPLQPAGTPFRRRVWEAITAIPAGETRTYGDLARLTHSAPRAVGGACGANPYPIAIPCHRVVAADRKFNDGLGGFARDRDGLMLDIKRWLLAHEGSR